MAGMFEIVTADAHIDSVSFAARTERVAVALTDAGIGAGDCVAVLMRNDIAFLEASLGARRIGAYCVPINWHSSPDEIRYVLNDCRAKLLVAHADLFRSLGDAPLPCPAVVAVVPDRLADAYRLSAEDRTVPADANDWRGFTDVAVRDLPVARTVETLIYTSGTTGHPKGVKRAPATPEQTAASEVMRLQVFGIGPGARVLVPAPLYHTAPNLFAHRAIAQGELLVMPTRFDPEGLLADIARHRITHLYAVPAMFTRMLALSEEVRGRYDLSSLRFVLHAGGPCAPQVKAAMIAWVGPVVEEYYGSTEAGPITHIGSADWLAHPGTVGRCIPGAILKIVDDNGVAVAAGEVGEILSRNSDYPDFTYLNRQADRDALDQDGLLSSGDLGYVDEDGWLFLCDRKRDLVISGGVNIYPAEIEAALLTVDGIADCAVFGVPDEEYSEALMAVIEPVACVTLDPAEVARALRGRIAGFKVPRHFDIVERLPREETGKVKKRLLREPYWAAAGRKI